MTALPFNSFVEGLGSLGVLYYQLCLVIDVLNAFMTRLTPSKHMRHSHHPRIRSL